MYPRAWFPVHCWDNCPSPRRSSELRLTGPLITPQCPRASLIQSRVVRGDFRIGTTLILLVFFCLFLCLPSSGPRIIRMLVQFISPHRPLKLCSFFFNNFSLHSSDWIISIDLSSSSLILSSNVSNLLLSLYGEFFISVTMFFNSTISSRLFSHSSYFFIEMPH